MQDIQVRLNAAACETLPFWPLFCRPKVNAGEFHKRFDVHTKRYMYVQKIKTNRETMDTCKVAMNFIEGSFATMYSLSS